MTGCEPAQDHGEMINREVVHNADPQSASEPSSTNLRTRKIMKLKDSFSHLPDDRTLLG